MATVLAVDDEALAHAAAILRSGGAVAFPTETVYGLGARATDSAGLEAIYRIKGRPSTNPLIVHVADVAQARGFTSGWTAQADTLAARFWPGPLTLVLQKSPDVLDAITAGGGTVALRCPAHPVAQALLQMVGPLAAPSANRSGQLSPTTAAHVRASLGDRVALILDGGPCLHGLESTVVDATAIPVHLLRPGSIGEAELMEYVGPLVHGPRVAGVVPSPGLFARHYAPTTALECAGTQQEADFLVNLYETAGLKVARYVLGPANAVAASRLYADLHALDAAGFDRIIATLPTDGPFLQAMLDRLARASAEQG